MPPPFELLSAIPTRLLPSLAIPVVELVPNLNLGWWVPPNLNLKVYKKVWPLRILLSILAWYPVFSDLLPLTEDSSHFSLMVLGVVASLTIRNICLHKEIERVENLAPDLWKGFSVENRRNIWVVATQVKANEGAARYVEYPTKIAAFVMFGLVSIILPYLEEGERYKCWLTYALFVSAGIGIGGTRNGGSIALDVIFRVMLLFGFGGFLLFLGDASDAMFLKSVP